MRLLGPRHPPAPIEPKAWGGKMTLRQKHPEATTPPPPNGGGLGVVAGLVAQQAAVTVFAKKAQVKPSPCQPPLGSI